MNIQHVNNLKNIVALVFGLILTHTGYAQKRIDSAEKLAPGGNPIFRDAWTADPAPLVVGDTLYVYTGSDLHDEKDEWHMVNWRAYSTSDMIHWKSYGVVLKPDNFRWAAGEAWAGEVAEKDGKYYLQKQMKKDDTL